MRILHQKGFLFKKKHLLLRHRKHFYVKLHEHEHEHEHWRDQQKCCGTVGLDSVRGAHGGVICFLPLFAEEPKNDYDNSMQ